MQTEMERPVALDIRPLTPNVGAIVGGASIAGATADTAAAIRAALLRYKVLFLRKQAFDPDQFVAFAELFGSLTLNHPTEAPAAFDDKTAASEQARASVWERDNSYRSDHWHTDVTFIDRPVAITMLRCLETPEYGGDTIFANTVAAYERLPAPLRDLADKLRAYHSLGPGMRERGRWTSPAIGSYITEHPVVRVHSETNERSLLLGSFVEHFDGISRDASVLLLKIFQDYITAPETFVRWSWQAGDFAMWDNRATQHYAVNDYGNAPRLMQRLTVAGGIPVGVDGRQSTVIKGDASWFSAIGPA